jgi:hypothetical protein
MYLEFIFISFLSLEAIVSPTHDTGNQFGERAHLSAVGLGWAESSAGRDVFVYQFLIGAGKHMGKFWPT